MRKIFAFSLALSLSVIGSDVYSSDLDCDRDKQASTLTLEKLPIDIFGLIIDCIKPGDIKSLRSVNKHCRSAVDRVFGWPLTVAGQNMGRFLETFSNPSSSCPLSSLKINIINGNTKVFSRLMQLLESNKSLLMLDLSLNEIGDAGAQSLAKALETNTTLEKLYLIGSQIGTEGAQSLAKALETNTTLQELYLGSNDRIGTNGAQFLAKALETNTTLEMLDLNSCNVGTNGALYINSMRYIISGKRYFDTRLGQIKVVR